MILLFTPYSAGVPSLSGHLPFNPLGSSSGPHAYITISLTNETSPQRPPSSSELLGFYCTEMFICSFIPVAFYILFRGFETSFRFLLISITEGLHSNVTFFFLISLPLPSRSVCVVLVFLLFSLLSGLLNLQKCSRLSGPCLSSWKLWRQRQENCNSKPSLGYIARFHPTMNKIKVY